MASNQTTASDVDVDLGRLFASIARDWRRIAGIALAVTLLAFAATFLVTPRYMGETRILIETRESATATAPLPSSTRRGSPARSRSSPPQTS